MQEKLISIQDEDIRNFPGKRLKTMFDIDEKVLRDGMARIPLSLRILKK